MSLRKKASQAKEAMKKKRSCSRNRIKKLEDEVNKIKKAVHGQLARVFKMRKNITGGKKQGQEPSAIRDP